MTVAETIKNETPEKTEKTPEKLVIIILFPPSQTKCH